MLPLFFALTFAITWPCFFAFGALADSIWRWPVLGVGIFAPAIVALALTARAEGIAGTRALLRRLFAWRVHARWYLFAAGYMAAIKLAVALVHRAIHGTWPRFGVEAWYVIVLATIFSVVTGGQSGEEIGWRGYALPRLAARFGLARASILLGIVWAVWHLPLFFVANTTTTGQSFPLYLLQVTALSIAMTWLYARTNGSLLLMMLMHSAINQSKDIVPSAVAGATEVFGFGASRVGWMTAALLWICAAYFLVTMKARLSPESPESVAALRLAPR